MSDISTQLKQQFLEKASPLIDEYIGAALGTRELSSTSAVCRDEVWKLLKTIILDSSSSVSIEARTMEEILVAVSSGQCTLEEGAKLLEMYTSVKGTYTSTADSTAGISINILGSTSLPKVLTHESKD